MCGYGRDATMKTVTRTFARNGHNEKRNFAADETTGLVSKKSHRNSVSRNVPPVPTKWPDNLDPRRNSFMHYGNLTKLCAVEIKMTTQRAFP